MTNDEPNKTFEISCSVTIPMCWGKEDAIEDFKNFIWRDQLELEVKDVTDEIEDIKKAFKEGFKGHKKKDWSKVIKVNIK